MKCNIKTLTSKKVLSISLLSNIAVIICLFALMFIFGIKPCPLCILQQFLIYLITVITICFLFINLKHRGQFFAQAIIILLSISGAVVAIIQIWMQMHPEKYTGVCVADVQSLLYHLPTNTLFSGLPDCASTSNKLFGISLSEYSLIYFILLILWHVFTICLARNIKISSTGEYNN